MSDGTFYDRNWTVLNKIRYLEKWFKKNSLDLSTLNFTNRQEGETVYVSLFGTNFEGKVFELPDFITYEVRNGVDGQNGAPGQNGTDGQNGKNAYLYGETVSLNSALSSGLILSLNSNKITPTTGYEVSDAIILIAKYEADEDNTFNYLSFGVITSIDETNNLVNVSITNFIDIKGGIQRENLLPYTVSIDLTINNQVPQTIQGRMDLTPGHTYLVKGKYGINGTPFACPLYCMNEGTVAGETFDGLGGLYTGENRELPGFGDDGMGVQFLLLTKMNASQEYDENSNMMMIGTLYGTEISDNNNPIIIEEVIDEGVNYFLHSQIYNVTIGELTGEVILQYITNNGQYSVGFERSFQETAKQRGYYSIQGNVYSIINMMPLLPSSTPLSSALGTSQIVFIPDSQDDKWQVLTGVVGKSSTDDSTDIPYMVMSSAVDIQWTEIQSIIDPMKPEVL